MADEIGRAPQRVPRRMPWGTTIRLAVSTLLVVVAVALVLGVTAIVQSTWAVVVAVVVAAFLMWAAALIGIGEKL